MIKLCYKSGCGKLRGVTRRSRNAFESQLAYNGSAVWVSSFTVNKVKYMISILIKLFTEDFYERRKVVNELPIQPVIPSLQQDDSDLLFHECPNCNCRCNCTDQPCSCCNEV